MFTPSAPTIARLLAPARISMPTRVRVTTPQRECWDETRYDNGGYTTGGHGQQVAGHTILGAVIGGVIGNQIGSGQGRHAARAAGAVIGAAIGHEQGMRRYGATTPAQPYTVQRCETRYHEEWQERAQPAGRGDGDARGRGEPEIAHEHRGHAALTGRRRTRRGWGGRKPCIAASAVRGWRFVKGYR